MFYKINESHENGKNIFVSDDFYKQYSESDVDSIEVQAGFRKLKVRLLLKSDLRNNEIAASKEVIDYLSIPENLLYQIKASKERISIGPVIGILVSVEKNTLTPKKLKRQISYALPYNEFKGLIYVFSWESINFKDGLVEGYYYKPAGDESEECFEKKQLPLPSVVYSRTLLSRAKEKKLKRVLDNKMFNSYRFSKLYFWNLASNCETVRKYIPETRLFSTIRDIDEMLEKYSSIYLKPVKGTCAKGLIKVSKQEDKYCFETNDKEEQMELFDKEVAANYFKQIKYNQDYIIQQGINSFNFEKRLTDFRVIMQKNENLKWGCTAAFAKLGKPEGICSNFMSSGYVLAFEKVFSRFLKLNDEEIRARKNQLIDVCKKVCEMLDETGENYGDIGIDVAIDEDFNIWILEVNTKHSHKVVWPLRNEKLFYNVKSNPVKYAVGLSCFDIVNEDNKGA